MHDHVTLYRTQNALGKEESKKTGGSKRSVKETKGLQKKTAEAARKKQHKPSGEENFSPKKDFSFPLSLQTVLSHSSASICPPAHCSNPLCPLIILRPV